VARARNVAAVRASLADHREPVVAVAYASVEGEAGVQLAGWVPRRRYPAGLVPVPGRSAIYDWAGPVPFRELPRARVGGGASGSGAWLVAADNVLPGAEPPGIEWLWRPGARAERIDALLRSAASAGSLDARTLAAIQGDLRSAGAAGLLEDALALAGSDLDDQAAEVAGSLREWNGEAAAASRGAALYHVFLDELTRELLAGRLGEPLLARWLALAHADPAGLVGRLLAGARAGGRDPSGWDEPAAVRRALRAALRDAWLVLSVRAGPNRDKWTWGRLHSLRFPPLLPVGRGVEPGLGPFEAAGDGHSIAATAFDPADPFATRSASLYRLVVDLGEAGHALSALAPGQSEHPGHDWRASGLARWRARRPSLLVSGSLLVEEGAVARLELVPARAPGGRP
jgi:penicillin amidase